jgi:hypothetical protein
VGEKNRNTASTDGSRFICIYVTNYKIPVLYFNICIFRWETQEHILWTESGDVLLELNVPPFFYEWSSENVNSILKSVGDVCSHVNAGSNS